MKVLITGKGGQLAWELEKSKPDQVALLSLDRESLDITDEQSVKAVVAEFQPDVVINAAAYTAVDRAETDQENAFAVNATGVANLAKACAEINAFLVQVSTDFVFDGTQTTPYGADDVTNPLGVYGASKLAGEKAVIEHHPGNSIIIRTAWVYSEHGNNFVKSMLRLMAEKPELGIVYDQVGTPTWAAGLAACIWQLIDQTDRIAQEQLIYGWTDAGVASWYDFAVAVQELAVEKGLLQTQIPVKAIPASAYPTPATRPSFSVLDKAPLESLSGVQTVHWRKQLSAMMDNLKSSIR